LPFGTVSHPHGTKKIKPPRTGNLPDTASSRLSRGAAHTQRAQHTTKENRDMIPATTPRYPFVFNA
jgi:hypothetical protein